MDWLIGVRGFLETDLFCGVKGTGKVDLFKEKVYFSYYNN